jgi:hypothetical protein
MALVVPHDLLAEVQTAVMNVRDRITRKDADAVLSFFDFIVAEATKRYLLLPRGFFSDFSVRSCTRPFQGKHRPKFVFLAAKEHAIEIYLTSSNSCDPINAEMLLYANRPLEPQDHEDRVFEDVYCYMWSTGTFDWCHKKGRECITNVLLDEYVKSLLVKKEEGIAIPKDNSVALVSG